MATTEAVDKRAALIAAVDQRIEELARARGAPELTQKVNAYAALQARFYKYSLRNTVLIEIQLAERGRTPTNVAGFHTWLKMNRVPRKGSGLSILAPTTYKERDEESGEERVSLRGFRIAYVFDVADTTVIEGRPDLYRAAQLQWTPVDGDYSPLLRRLLDVARAQRIRVEIGEGEEGLRGLSDGRGRIWLNSALSSGQSCGTLLHEMAHELCHDLERRREVRQQAHGRARLECEAEASAYCLCGHLNVPRPDSGQYLALHGISAAELRSSLEAIRTIVTTVLAAVEQQQEGGGNEG